jgi:FkbM family methyltransferase
MIQILKKLKYKLEGRLLIKPQIIVNKIWLGNDYGGFYVHPDSLNDKSIIYSIGIGEDISFDTAIINNFNSKVYGFDPTKKSVTWVKKNVNNPNFIFSDVGIASESGKKKFFLPRNNNFVSGSIEAIDGVNTESYDVLDFKTLREIMQEFKHTKIDLLKMDIEGAEYTVLPQILNENIDIKQIVLEFHSHMIKNGKSKTKEAIDLLNSKKYQCFGVSKSFCEFSFIKLS